MAMTMTESELPANILMTNMGSNNRHAVTENEQMVHIIQ